MDGSAKNVANGSAGKKQVCSILLQHVVCTYYQSKKTAKPPTVADIVGKCNDVVSSVLLMLIQT